MSPTRKKVQRKSKNSELAHANIGNAYCLTTVYKPRVTRTIGETQPSCVKPDSYQNPRRNGRGGAVGNMLKLVHAQSGGWAGNDTNVCTHDYTDISTHGIGPVGNYDQHGNCWNKLKGYVHTSVLAQIERYRNIGVWRFEGNAHISVRAQCWSWSDASKWRL